MNNEESPCKLGSFFDMSSDLNNQNIVSSTPVYRIRMNIADYIQNIELFGQRLQISNDVIMRAKRIYDKNPDSYDVAYSFQIAMELMWPNVGLPISYFKLSLT